ncbi:MAG: Helix-turn-helix domain [Gammaproteobacteria bacterium]|jgi:transcriptional regulator with XRE-family HTH domain|nr:Helix-turn-helix domain [Gammaproteobacteria bacterium]
MTQEDVAKLLHTHKPAISCLEAGDSNIRHFPSLLTITKFATALGYHLTIRLVPMKNIRKKELRAK